MIDYLLEKIPLVLSWIDKIIYLHAANAISVKSLITMHGFKRLPLYFTHTFLSKAKCVLIDKIPVPPLSSFGLTQFAGFENGDYSGMTYRDTYFVKWSICKDESLHFHELIHVVQWDYLGAEKFLIGYALGLIQHGYAKSPLEIMAYKHQRAFETGVSPYPVINIVASELNTGVLPVVNEVLIKSDITKRSMNWL
jgi:hypothetical protein